MDYVQFTFVTLITSDSYLPGALVVAAALRGLHPSPPPSAEELDPSQFHITCLVTPETVSVQTLKLLRRTFDVVIGVEVIKEDTDEALELLGRPDLGTVLTKLHVFRLTSYRKIVYLDADVLPLLPLSHLFHDTSSFSAVPDVGWPDIFNSGVLVFTPGVDDFKDIMQLVRSKGSWDGGDQGVLNEWRGDNWKRLSFTYNTTPTALYTYAPAYKRFGSGIKAIHFIGPNKPWSVAPFRAPGNSFQSVASTTGSSPHMPESHNPYAYSTLLDRWFSVFDQHYRSTAPIFTTTGALMATAVFKEKVYHNVWDSVSSKGIDSMGEPMGLDKLRQLALEGLGQTPLRQAGEGVYMTLPLEGRIDLMESSCSHFRKYLPLRTHTSALAPAPASLSTPEILTPVEFAFSALTLSAQNATDRPSIATPIHDPWNGTFTNAWDLVPGIQRYASGQRTVRNNVKAGQENVQSVYRSWEDRAESSSRDGDDEADDEDNVKEKL